MRVCTTAPTWASATLTPVRRTIPAAMSPAGLTLYRRGGIDAWVAWSADGVSRSASRAAAVLEAAAAVQHRWAWETAGLRADSTARRLLPLLPAHPVVTAAMAASLPHVSVQAARSALTALAAAHVLVDVDRVPRRTGRPRRWWVASEMLELVGR